MSFLPTTGTSLQLPLLHLFFLVLSSTELYLPQFLYWSDQLSHKPWVSVLILSEHSKKNSHPSHTSTFYLYFRLSRLSYLIFFSHNHPHHLLPEYSYIILGIHPNYSPALDSFLCLLPVWPSLFSSLQTFIYLKCAFLCPSLGAVRVFF